MEEEEVADTAGLPSAAGEGCDHGATKLKEHEAFSAFAFPEQSSTAHVSSTVGRAHAPATREWAAEHLVMLNVVHDLLYCTWVLGDSAWSISNLPAALSCAVQRRGEL